MFSISQILEFLSQGESSFVERKIEDKILTEAQRHGVEGNGRLKMADGRWQMADAR